jgi:hypothetical protein
LRLRLTHDELRFALGLLADFAAQLLRADQGVVQRLVAVAKGLQLLVEAARFLVEFLIGARQSLDLLGDLFTKLVDARPVVPRNALPKS